jgi:DNA-binding MarR family transcriptional regulator
MPDDILPTDESLALADSFEILWELLLDPIGDLPQLGSLTVAQLRLLCWIQERVPVTWQEAEREFGRSAVWTARLIRVLVRRGLVERCGDMHDRHSVWLRLSAQGGALLSRMEASQRQTCRRLLAPLSPEQQALVAQGLSLLLRTGKPSQRLTRCPEERRRRSR